MISTYDVLKRVVLSEKSTELRESKNQYVFEVPKKVTKTEIKESVEMAFGVKVVSVNTAIYRGKVKRRGYNLALLSGKKKAFVTVKEGQTIKLFDDQ
jgi:large subunit ribosomal protein L23